MDRYIRRVRENDERDRLAAIEEEKKMQMLKE
jgi:hypothetical protein